METCSFEMGYLMAGSIQVVAQIPAGSIMGESVQVEELQSWLAGSRTPLVMEMIGQLAH